MNYNLIKPNTPTENQTSKLPSVELRTIEGDGSKIRRYQPIVMTLPQGPEMLPYASTVTGELGNLLSIYLDFLEDTLVPGSQESSRVDEGYVILSLWA